MEIIYWKILHVFRFEKEKIFLSLNLKFARKTTSSIQKKKKKKKKKPYWIKIILVSKFEKEKNILSSQIEY